MTAWHEVCSIDGEVWLFLAYRQSHVGHEHSQGGPGGGGSMDSHAIMKQSPALVNAVLNDSEHALIDEFALTAFNA